MTDLQQTKRPTEWLAAGTFSGFIATGVMTLLIFVGIGVAGVIGSPDAQEPALVRWMWALSNNTVTERTESAFPVAVGLHFISGVGWALVYAALVEPRLRGPGWRRGLLFSVVPWVASLVVFLPAVGGGLLGLGLGAGPLPIVGNLALHAAYGLVLGQVQSPWGEQLLVESGEEEKVGELQVVAHQQRIIALSIVVGLVVGGLVGLLGSAAVGVWSSPAVATVLGAIAGSVAGSFIGSFLGLPAE